MPETMPPPTSPSAINEPLEKLPAEKTPEEKLFSKDAGDAKPAEPPKPKEPEPGKPEPGKPEPEAKANEVPPKPEAPEKGESQEPTKSSPEAKPAPVDYENLKLPEGSLLSQNELTEIKKVAKEQGLTLEEVTGVLEVKNDAVKAFAQRQQEALTQARKSWREAWTNDPEYGGDNLKKNTELAKRAWDRLADSELKKLADETGWGDHPAVLRLMTRVGRLFAEDSMVRGQTGQPQGKKSPEEILYGATTPVESK